jgi:hypothetical protein
VIFSPVAYLKETQVAEQLVRVTESIRANQEFLQTIDRAVLLATAYWTLLSAVVSLKHEAFSEELEWRVIYAPNRAASELIDYKTEVIGGVPQMICKLPLDATRSPAIASLDVAQIFERLIIGPTHYGSSMEAAFVRELTAAGIQDAVNKVFPSNIPIRA